MAIKADVSNRVWQALYQQNPIPNSGLFFLKEYLYYVPQLPDPRGGQVCTGWDFAIGEKKRNNFTCGTTIQQMPSTVMYVRNVRKIKKSATGIIQAMIDEAQFYLTMENPPYYTMAVEDGHIWRSIKDSVKAAFDIAGVPMSIVYEYTPIVDKEARATPMQDKMERGHLRLPEVARWLRGYVTELMKFPNAKDLDQVDSSAWAVKRLIEQGPPRAQEIETTTIQQDRYADKKFKGWRDRMLSARSRKRTSMSA
jgi:predicted phage terminase large subunit-like protein